MRTKELLERLGEAEGHENLGRIRVSASERGELELILTPEIVADRGYKAGQRLVMYLLERGNALVTPNREELLRALGLDYDPKCAFQGELIVEEGRYKLRFIDPTAFPKLE